MPRQIIIAVCFFLTLVLGIFLVWPEYQELKGLKSKITEKEGELQTLKEHFLELDDLSKNLKQYEVELSKIDSALPDGFDLPSLLNYLQEAASGTGLILKSFSPVSSTPFKGKIKEFRLSLGFSGSYSAFKNFLSSLEKSARLIEVENISFSSPLGEEKPFDFSLGIKVYSY